MKKKDMLLLIEQQSKAIADLERRLLNIEIDRATHRGPFEWEQPPRTPFHLVIKGHTNEY
jgi:hypothetical protein